MDDAALMKKYNLSSQGLQSAFRKLVEANVLKQSELDNRVPLAKGNVDIVWKCPACGKPQPREFDECPECGVILSRYRRRGISSSRLPELSERQPTGRPPSRLGDRVRLILAGVGIVALLLLIALVVGLVMGPPGHSPATPSVAEREPARPELPTIEISAGGLYGQYNGNEVAADAQFKGRLLAVKGQIDNIGKDILGKMYVALKTGFGIGRVQCFFGKEYANELARLRPGQNVTIEGRCTGKMMNVLLQDCDLLNK